MTGGLEVAVAGASRTDAGVHAAAQVAHLDLPDSLPPAALARGLNAILPPAIRVRSASHARPTFHARHHAVGKLYSYRVRWSPPTLPWLAQRTAWVRRPVTRFAAMAEVVATLPGRRDWASFTVPDHGQPSSVRTVSRAWCQAAPGGLDFHFVGDGFLRYQVRRLVGTLLLVGWGRLAPADVAALLAVPQPGAGILTAAAEGLTLERVYYRSTPLLEPPPVAPLDDARQAGPPPARLAPREPAG